MYIVNGVAHADNPNDIGVKAVEYLGGMKLLLTFCTGEKRLYDGAGLLKFPAFKPLAKSELFMSAKIEHGVVTWCDGSIDIAPETMYQESTPCLRQ